MTNEELKAAIDFYSKCEPNTTGYLVKIMQAARELSQLKDGTHPDMVMVPREPTIDIIVKANITIRQYEWLIAAAQKGETK